MTEPAARRPAPLRSGGGRARRRSCFSRPRFLSRWESGVAFASARRLTRIAVLPALLLAAVLASCADNRVHLTVFHTNDIHGWIAARDAGKLDARRPKRQVGGFAALAAVVRSHKGPKLLLDAGDWFQGTPEGGLTGGRAPVELMGELGYDATVVGNHEYDIGEAGLKELVKTAKFPVLGANVYDVKTGKRVGYLLPHVIKEVEGVRVGIFGLITSNMKNLSFAKNIRGLKFRREVEEAREQVRALKEAGADIIIAVTHIGFRLPDRPDFEDDQFLAAEVPGIDLIVGGHTHTALDKMARAANGAWIVQAGQYLQRVGKVSLVIDRGTKKIVDARWRLLTLFTGKTGEDPGLLEKVADYRRRVGEKLDVPIGKAKAAFFRAQNEESTMGNWMTDCLRAETKADAGFQNSGGIRSDFPAGPVTLRHVYEVMPFDNAVVVLKMRGRDLRDILETGVTGGMGLLQVSGVTFEWDPEAPKGKRVVSAEIGGAPLKDDRLYTAVASDFMATGGDGYSAFSRAEKTEIRERLLRDVFGECVKKVPEIAPPPVGRIRAAPGAAKKAAERPVPALR